MWNQIFCKVDNSCIFIEISKLYIRIIRFLFFRKWPKKSNIDYIETKCRQVMIWQFRFKKSNFSKYFHSSSINDKRYDYNLLTCYSHMSIVIFKHSLLVLADTLTMPVVKLQSCDGQDFPVDAEVAKMSMTIKQMLEELTHISLDFFCFGNYVFASTHV